MDKELKELMQISVISENEFLSGMLADIMPTVSEKTAVLTENIEQQKSLEHNTAKSQEFRIVVYKKDNPLIRFFKGIKFALKKIKILGASREINLAKNNISNK